MNQLKEAEKKATLIVQEARKGASSHNSPDCLYLFSYLYIIYYVSVARGDRMKEAKSEAEKIIASYKADMEATYQVSLAKVRYASHFSSSMWCRFLTFNLFFLCLRVTAAAVRRAASWRPPPEPASTTWSKCRHSVIPILCAVHFPSSPNICLF